MKFSNLFEVKMSHSVTLQQENINDVLVGFEIECMLTIEDTTKLKRDVDKAVHDQSVYQREVKMQLLQDSTIKHLIHNVVDDGSLESFNTSEIPIEIITKPLKYTQAIDGLKLLFGHLSSVYNMRTNNSCSLHVNLSCKGTRNQTIDLMKLVAFLGDEYFLKVFDRSDNEFTQQMKVIFNTIIPEELPPSSFIINLLKDKKQEIFKLVTKYFAVNPNKLQNGYLEFRIIGGKDYEKKIDKILLAISHFTHVMLIASGNDYVNEYNKKLTNILNKLIEKEYEPDTYMLPIERQIINLIIKYNPSLKTTKIERPEIVPFIAHNFYEGLLRHVSAKDKQAIKKYMNDKLKQYSIPHDNRDAEVLLQIINKLGWRLISKVDNKTSLEDVVYLFNYNVPYNKDERYKTYGHVVNTLSDNEMTQMFSILNNICSEKNSVPQYTKRHIKTYLHELNNFAKITRNVDFLK